MCGHQMASGNSGFHFLGDGPTEIIMIRPLIKNNNTITYKGLVNGRERSWQFCSSSFDMTLYRHLYHTKL